MVGEQVELTALDDSKRPTMSRPTSACSATPWAATASCSPARTRPSRLAHRRARAWRHHAAASLRAGDLGAGGRHGRFGPPNGWIDPATSRLRGNRWQRPAKIPVNRPRAIVLRSISAARTSRSSPAPAATSAGMIPAWGPDAAADGRDGEEARRGLVHTTSSRWAIPALSAQQTGCRPGQSRQGLGRLRFRRAIRQAGQGGQ